MAWERYFLEEETFMISISWKSSEKSPLGRGLGVG